MLRVCEARTNILDPSSSVALSLFSCVFIENAADSPPIVVSKIPPLAPSINHHQHNVEIVDNIF
jgi:hypothetical protein